MKELVDASVDPPKKIANDPLIQRYQRMLTEVEFTIIEQSGNYGNGTPLILAEKMMGDEPCIYAFGDDVVLYCRMECPVLAAQRVDETRKSLFGILECRKEGGVQHVVRLLEKPLPGETLSNLAAFGRYLVTTELMEDLRNVVPGRDRELWFVDSVIRRISNGGDVCAFALTSGKWYTVGDPSSYAEATKAAAEMLAV
jgi:UTP--glucose-1-phosphate uridylyltransferase